MLNISFALSFYSIGCSTFSVYTYILTPRQQRTDAENSIETWKKEIAECQEKQQAATEQITELVDEQEKQKQLLESSELEDFERQSEPASVSESDTKEQESEETK